MGRVLKVLGYIVGALVLLVLVLVAGVWFNANRVQTAKVDRPVAAITVQSTPERIARGQYLATAFPGCAGCHSSNPIANPPVMDGGTLDAAPLAVFYPPNLTPGGALKDWSDGEIIRAIREGISKDGRPLVLMPSQNFKNMSDEDVQSVVAYLRSQPAVTKADRPTQIMPLGTALLGTGQVPTAVQAPVSNVTAPPRAATAEYGKYIVSMSDCKDCHGANLDALNVPPGPEPGPSLRIVKGWTDAQFITTLRTGTDPAGHKLDPEKMPWPSYGQGTDNDLKAIYEYLKSLQ